MLIALRIAKWIGAVLAVLLLTFYFGRAFDARGMLPLGPEHRIEFENEFRAAHEERTDWAAYLTIGKAIALELGEKIDSATRPEGLADRHSAKSLTFPDNYASNWNRSFEMSVPNPRGVAVLLHGLTDSPYSMLATAQTLAGAGYNVVVPRMPGHGFAVSGLLHVRSEDWSAAVRIAVRHAMSLPGSKQDLLLAGYSNGGLLAVDYALQCDDIDDMQCPDGLILMSPGIGISEAARVMNWHSALSWIPYFEKFKWLAVLPEINPFKFTSFPKHAAWEAYKLSKRVHKQLADPASAAKMPPVLAFQSVVDNTINATAIVTSLYENLPANGSELVVYDINRNSTLLHLMKERPEHPADYFQSRAPLSFGVTIIGNRSESGMNIDAFKLSAGQTEIVTEPTSFSWPDNFYSLSHIAIPFRVDDMVYGDGTTPNANNPGIVIGALAPLGEKGVLLLTSDYFLRTKYNPFYGLQASKLTQWLNARQHEL
jgi:esterase/lipase